jgi:UPF0755 protein
LSRGNRSQPAHERTAEERERDREERERRRAGRSSPGQPSQAPVDAAIEPAVDESPSEQPASEQRAVAQPAAVEVEHPPLLPAELSSSHEPDADMQPGVPGEPFDPIDPVEPVEPGVSPGPAAASEPVFPGEPMPPAEPPAASVNQSATELHEDDPSAREQPGEDGSDPADGEASADLGEAPGPPIPRVRREVPLARRAVPPATLEPRGRASGGRGTGWGRGSRAGGGTGGRRLTRARGGALLALAAAAVLVWFLLSLFQPFAGSGTGRVIVEIPKGSSSSKIGSILDHDGVVSSGFFFNLRALLEGKRSSLHSGRFQLKRDMSYSAAIEALSQRPPRTIAVKVVVPEGYTRRQIAELVQQDALKGSYLAASKHSRLLDPARYGAPASTPDLEGFLFPATYEMTAGSPVSRLVDEQLLAFRRRFSSSLIRRARALDVTPYQLLTVASMIEREAQIEHDRPRIAAVIYNRLREGIPLGIDATIYYAVERQKGIATYTQELSESQLKIDSPYNTRTHKGLPPTPISNPGLASIEAAAHPSHVGYLYYVAAADGCGEQIFSSTFAEFQKNAAAYEAAVKKNGGHPPTCKKK